MWNFVRPLPRGQSAGNHALTWALVSPRPQPFMLPQVHSAICHFRSEKETGAEMRAAIFSGIVTGDAPFSYWPMFLPDPSNRPRILHESELSPVLFSFLKWGIDFITLQNIRTAVTCLAYVLLYLLLGLFPCSGTLNSIHSTFIHQSGKGDW